jgi:hypothetical protein
VICDVDPSSVALCEDDELLQTGGAVLQEVGVGCLPPVICWIFPILFCTICGAFFWNLSLLFLL